MEKVLFVDWDRCKTVVRPIRLEGDGFIQDAKLDRKYVVEGDPEKQVYQVAELIGRINPDRVIMDCGGIGAGLGQMLRDILGKVGVREKSPEDVPAYNPPKDLAMGRW